MADETSLEPGREYVIKHTTRTTRVKVTALDYRLDVNTLHRDKTATALKLNELGRISLRTQVPLLLDEYSRNAATGSFILIDPNTNGTVAAGMILPFVTARTASPNTVRHESLCTAEDRLSKGRTVWFTGLSGSGKSSVAMLVEQKLLEKGRARIRSRWRQPAPRPERRSGVLDGRSRREPAQAGSHRRHSRRLRSGRARARDQPARGAPRLGAPGAPPKRASTSSRCSATLRSRTASVETRRGCTPRPEQVRSPTSPESTARTSGRRSPICGSPPTARRTTWPTWSSKCWKPVGERSRPGGRPRRRTAGELLLACARSLPTPAPMNGRRRGTSGPTTS